MRRRDELLGAARRVIGRDGFAGATVGTITREAGASLGLLNYHFGSRDEVVAEAFAAAAREDLDALEAISRRFEAPPERLAAYLDQSEWADQGSWRLWIDAWGSSIHSSLVRDTLGRFDVGWRAVLAEVLADGVRQGCWACADVQDTAARLVAVLDGIGLHATVHGEDVPPARAAAWARRLAELELGVTLPSPPVYEAPRSASVHRVGLSIRARDLDAHGHVDPAVLFTFLEEARLAWLGDRVPEAVVTHVAVRYLRSLGRDAVEVTCTLDTVGRASFRTRETVATADGVAVEAATTLEVPGRALTSDEREALAA
ncbi:TetR family transcriptional regulator C-terminal domain-containing protein [Solirubrobacter taibaiensis]|nr:TetR family transcriptional regulator C-terminal domain-containing protein [Solirubrobacter taibaiensis]